MASSMMSSPAVTTVNRGSMVAPFTGLKSMVGFPVRKTNYDISSIASNSGRVQCMQQGFVYRENHRSPEYYDGKYWTMWKLPMFGCRNSAQMLKEVDEAVKAYPTAFIRIMDSTMFAKSNASVSLPTSPLATKLKFYKSHL